jgi:hypothetical protein
MRVIFKLIRKFWFPILIVALKLMSKRFPWAKKALAIITKLK